MASAGTVAVVSGEQLGIERFVIADLGEDGRCVLCEELLASAVAVREIGQALGERVTPSAACR